MHEHGGAPRHGRQRRRRPAATALRIVATVAAVAVVSTGSLGAIASWEVVRVAQPTVSLAVPGTAATHAPPLTARAGEVNMLLVATDTRSGQGAGFDDAANQRASTGVGNNDSNLLVHISADHRDMAVVSFPRDLVIPIPACEDDSGAMTPASDAAMLNTALGRGGERHGLACVAQTIEHLTGVTIGYAGMITFDGVVAMADAVGGVDVCLATPIDDPDVSPALHLAAGDHDLSGAQAAAFLRSRHGVGDASDLARISNQQTFMAALARQTVSAHTLSDPVKVLRLASEASRHMTLSDTLADPTTLARLALAVQTVGLTHMAFVQYPVVDDPQDSARVLVAQDSAAALDHVLQTDQPVVLGASSLGRSAVRAAGTPGTPSSDGPGGAATSPATGGAARTTTGTVEPSTAATTPPTAAALPDDVTGQEAATATCAAKR